MFRCKLGICVFLAGAGAHAELHTLTLRQTVELAARQNPDVKLAQLDQQRAEQGIRIARDPFRPKVYSGSGLAYTYGYPNSIEGNAPSLIQVRTDMSLFNRQQAFALAGSKEIARGSEFAVAAKADEMAFQAADLFLTASQVEHQGESLYGQLPSLQKVVETISAAVTEGTELPLELKRAQTNLAMSRQQLDAAHLDGDYYEMMLAIAVGYPATDRVKPIEAGVPLAPAMASEEEAETVALRSNHELQQLQSSAQAKELDYRSYRSVRVPKVDLVAQYALFAKYNFSQYFQKFQRNNFQIGASVTIPILVGSAAGASAQQAYTDLLKLRIQMGQVRNRVLTDVRRDYDLWKKAQQIRDLARMQLDLAREDLTLKLAQNGEGRLPLRALEQARLEESNRWIQLFDAETQVTRAKLAILRQTGTLLTAVRAAGENP